MPRLDEEPEWEELDDGDRQLIRSLAKELGMAFTEDSDEDDELTYE